MAAVDFTHDEAKALLALIDIAVKAQGLNIAEAAAVLASKISQVLKETEKPAGE